jgi:hypothetical protein
MTRPIRRGAKFHIHYTYMYRLCQVKTEASILPGAYWPRLLECDGSSYRLSA